jgi:intein-encoded DNA endonuclease-like protein
MVVGTRNETNPSMMKILNEIHTDNTAIESEGKTLQETDIQPKYIADYIEKFGDSDFEYCSDCSTDSHINYENSFGDDTNLKVNVQRK